MALSVRLHIRQNVFISEVSSNGNFYIQLDSPDLVNLETLSNQISELVKNNPNASQGFHPSAGTHCFAQSLADNVWYRATVLTCNSETSYTVYYVDYGNTEESLPLTRLFPSVTDFFKTPYQAICCRLAQFTPIGGGAWTEEVTQAFRENVLNQTIPGEFHRQIPTEDQLPIFSVTLYWDDSEEDYTVAEELVAMGLGTYSPVETEEKPPCDTHVSSVSNPQPVVPVKTFSFIELEVGQRYSVYVTHADNPDIVWCQLSENTDQFEALVIRLREYMESTPTGAIIGDPSKVPSPEGEPCCIIYEEDETWCRGFIEAVDVTSGTADVLFVDFGNTETIPISKLFTLSSEFLDVPAQAVSFSLNGILCVGDSWSPDALARFTEFYSDQELLCEVVGLDENGYPSVRLTNVSSQFDIASVLIQEGFATDRAATAISNSHQSGTAAKMVTGNNSNTSSAQTNATYKPLSVLVGLECESCVTSIDSLSLFYCQLFSQAEQLSMLTNQIHLYCNSPNVQPVSHVCADMPVLVQFKEDEEWYRGYMIPPTDDTLNEWGVFFVDYGNKQGINIGKLKEIPLALLELPAQAFPCCLAGFPPSRLSEKSVLSVFSELVLNEAVECLVKKKVVGDDGKSLYLVEIIKDSVNVLEQLMQVDSTKMVNIPSLPAITVPADERMLINVCFIESTNRFACQLVDNVSIIENLQSQLNSCEHANLGKELVKPVIGTCCAALFSEDEQLYRARVQKVHPEGQVEVLFADYGNTEVVPLTNTYELLDKHLKLPNQAIICSLDGVPPTCVTEVTATFEEMCLGQTVEAEFLLTKCDLQTIVPCKIYKPSTDTLIVNDIIPSAREISPVSVKTKTTEKLHLPAGSRSGSRSRQSSETPLIYPLFPMVPSQMDVFVSYIISPSEFYVQPLVSSTDLQTLMDDMFTYYSTQRKGFPLQSPYVGVHCSAPYSDGSYYRGIVKTLDSQNTQVFYLDFGNTEVIPLKDLFTLSSRFTSLPAQAIVCCLSGVSMATGATANCDWSKDCIYNMKEAILEKEVQMNVVNIISETCYEVVITVHSQNLSDLMVETGLALKGTSLESHSKSPSQQHLGTPSFSTSSSSTASTPTKGSQPNTKQYSIPSLSPLFNQELGVIVTEISPKCNIYCQLVSSSNQIEELKSAISNFVATNPKPLKQDEVKKGKYILSQFTEDDGWYRGKILLTENEIKVGYVDFGNQETVPLSRLCELPAILHDIPAQAVRCQLNGMERFQPVAGAQQALEEELLYAECTMKVLRKEVGQKFIVDLVVVDDGRNVMEWAVRSGLFSPLGQTADSQSNGGRNEIFTSAQYTDSDFGKSPPKNLTIPSFISTLGPKQNSLSGYLVYVDSPTMFYVQPADSAQQMEMLSSEMQEHYKNQVLSKNTKSATPLQGQFLAALYSEDQHWYRVLVVDTVTKSDVNVLFIDYGNLESVPISNVRPLQPQFAFLPSQGIQCRLNVIQPTSQGWNHEDKEIFSSLIEESLVKLRVGKVTKSFLEVFEIATEEGLDVCEELVKKGCATHLASKSSSRSSSVGARSPKKRWQSGSSSSSTSSQASSLSSSSNLPAPFKVREGEILSVYVSHRDVGAIWVQPAAQTLELSALTDTMAETYVPPLTNQLQLRTHKPGKVCCAQFSEDDVWYRARITAQPGKEGTSVLFLDYGNTDILPLERICSLRKEFQVLPLLAIPCVLDSSSSALSMPVDSEETINIQLVKQLKNKKWKASIIQNDANLAAPSPFPRPGSPDIANITIPSLTLNPSDQNLVYIVHSESPDSFWCQLSNQSEALDELMALMADFYTDKCPAIELEQGTFCVAQYSENSTWYRAKVISEKESNNSVSVFFVDYGNREVLNSDKVAGLDPQFSSLPCQAFHCSLFENTPSAFKEKHLESFYSLNFDQTFTVTLRAQLLNGVWLVNLNDEECQSINDIFSNPTPVSTSSLEATLTYPTPHFGVGSEIDVFITCVNGPDSYFCQPLEMASDLEELMTNIANYMSGQPSTKNTLSLDTLNIGQSCLARYTAEDEWFRAQIEDFDVDKNQVLVHYTDYGNMAYLQLDRVMSLPPQFLSAPTQVLHCSAVLTSPLSEPFSAELIESFLQLIQEDSQYTVRITGFSHSSQKYTVEMYSNIFKQSDITHLQAQLLNSAGISMNIVPSQATSTSVDDDAPSSLLNRSQDDLDNLPVTMSNSGLKGSKTPTTDLEESEGESTTMGEPLIHAPCKLSLANKEVVNVFVVHVQDPSLMHIQRVDCSNELESLSQEINQYCSDFADKLIQDTYHPGDFILALYDVDGVWYRAHVRQVLPEKLLNVQFIDFGNSEDVATDKVIMCPGNFLELPIQAIPCSLAHVPNRENWPVEYKNMIDKLITEKEMKATVIVPGGQGMSAAVLLNDLENTFEVSQKVLEHLQEECDAGVEEVLAGMDKSEETVENEEEGDEIKDDGKGGNSEIVDDEPGGLPKESRVQGWEETDLNKEMERLNTEDECSQLQELEEDVLDVEKSEEMAQDEVLKDEQESEVIKEEETSCNEEEVGEGSHQESGAKGGDLNDQVQIESKVDVFTPLSEQSKQQQLDQLAVKGTVPPPRPASPAPNARVLQIGDKYDVYLINVASPYDFVCQLYNDSGVLDSITSVLEQLYSRSEDKYEFESPPAVGEYVCALYSKDDSYYRAKVLQVLEDGDGYEIEFIDYGNLEVVPMNSLKQLDPQVVVYSPLALKCGLSGLPEDQNRSDHFTSTLVHEMLGCGGEEEVLSMEVTGIGEDGVYDVVLNTSTVCVNDVIFEAMSRLLREQESAENDSNIDICVKNDPVVTDADAPTHTSENAEPKSITPPTEPVVVSEDAALTIAKSNTIVSEGIENCIDEDTPYPASNRSANDSVLKPVVVSEDATLTIGTLSSIVSEGIENCIDEDTPYPASNRSADDSVLEPVVVSEDATLTIGTSSSIVSENCIDEDTPDPAANRSADDSVITIAKEYPRHFFKPGDTVTVLVVLYQSLSEIHCQIINKEMLSNIREAIAEKGFTVGDGETSINGLSLSVNTPLLVFSSEDGSWLRASLVEVSSLAETALVTFTDFGTTREEKLENIKLLPQSLAVLSPPLSFVCRFPHLLETDLNPHHGFQDEEWELEWPDIAVKYFSEVIEGKSSLTAKVVSIDDDDMDMITVKLSYTENEETVDVRETVIAKLKEPKPRQLDSSSIVGDNDQQDEGTGNERNHTEN